MNELILVRHGDADHLSNGMTGGWSSSHLTDLGRRQAFITGVYLRELIDDRPFQFYASDLCRSEETAAFVSEHLHLEATLSPELRELNNGAAANLTTEEVRVLESPMTTPTIDRVPYPQGESWRMLVERVQGFMDKIADDEHDLTLLVTHGNTGVVVIHSWLQLPESTWSKVSFDLDPCSVTHLTVNAFHEKTVSKLNDTCHLRGLDV